MGDLCACESGYADSGTGCVDEATLATCATGFYNDGSDTCVACGAGCLECSILLGECTSCETGWFVSALDS